MISPSGSNCTYLGTKRLRPLLEKIFDCWIPRHGAPEQIHHDQGKKLTAEMIQEICSFFEIWNTQTTLFHPKSDRASEQSIRTVYGMLAKIVKEDQRNWLYIPFTCLAYKTSVHSSTGFTPSFLEFVGNFSCQVICISQTPTLPSSRQG